ncbi:MAG: sorbitol dehydrogenase [Nitrospinota bacterium]|nr:MAG: sorbitol dehydrogenase [Nitrospinota bacterium]
MRVAMVYDFQDVRIEERPIPAISPQEVLVQMRACGICSSDVMDWYIRRKAPLVLGHEPAGVIVEVGAEVEGFRVGDRVFIHHHAPCMQCRDCRRGNHTLCETWRNSQLDPGGLAEFVRVPAINLQHDTLLLPPTLSFAEGTLVEPVGCVVKAMQRAGVQAGDIVLVIGLGFMGQLNVLLAKAYGAGLVLAADLVPYRLEKAIQMGADWTIDVSRESLEEVVAAYTEGVMADRVIVGPGTLPAMESGIRCVGKGGTVLFFTPTPPDSRLEIDPYTLYFREVTLTSSYSCGPPHTREALSWLEKGMIPADQLITHRFPLEETPQAVQRVAEGGEVLKALIVFDH